MYINRVETFRRFVRSGPYAWPGGYEQFAVTSDGGILCYDCCEKERRNIVDAIARKDHNGWNVIGADCTANSDEMEVCSHCGSVIFNPMD